MGQVAVPKTKTKQTVTVAKYLGAGTSFNVSNIPGYRNFTVNNFAIEQNGNISFTGPQVATGGYDDNYLQANGGSTINKSYNANTGVLTASITVNAQAVMYQGGSSNFPTSSSGSGSVKAWVIYQTEITN